MSRGHVLIGAAFAALVCLVGCQRASDITKEALLERTRHWKEPKVAIWYYAGSAEGYDYFHYDDLGVSQLYRVSSGEIALPRTFPHTRDRSRWMVMPWGPMAKQGQSSNHAMERTAARCVSSSFVAKTHSLRFTLALGGGRSSPSR